MVPGARRRAILVLEWRDMRRRWIVMMCGEVGVITRAELWVGDRGGGFCMRGFSRIVGDAG